MPHALTDRQSEYLQYLKAYIAKNESAPALETIAQHFHVKPSTAHKILEALQSKGFLYFGRDSISGFFIRLIERAGAAETVMEVAIAGKADGFGEVLEFPAKLGHFASVLVGSNPEEVFALVMTEDLPQAGILAQDLILFDMGKKPQPGDICIAPIGSRLFLIRIHSKTYDKDTPSPLLAQDYPIPERLTPPTLEQDLNWSPLAYDASLHDHFVWIAKQEHWPIRPLAPELIVATALRLVRFLAFNASQGNSKLTQTRHPFLPPVE